MAHFERFEGGMFGCVNSGEFHTLPNISVQFGPLKFSLHDLDAHQWRMTFAQKIISGSRLMRGKVNIFPTDKTHLGFNVKISGDWYRSWPDVISGLIGTKNGITFAEAEASQETFASLLERHNQDLVAELGEWRPVVASERASNVIDISKFIDRIMSEAA